MKGVVHKYGFRLLKLEMCYSKEIYLFIHYQPKSSK